MSRVCRTDSSLSIRGEGVYKECIGDRVPYLIEIHTKRSVFGTSVGFIEDRDLDEFGYRLTSGSDKSRVWIYIQHK